MPKKTTREQLNTSWNLLLLARSFDLETHLTPEDCAQQLADLHEPYRFLRFDLAPRTAAKVEIEDEGYEFDLRTKRRNRGVDYTTVKATGRIIYSHGLNATLIRGTIKLGWLFLVLTVGALLFVSIALIGGFVMGEIPLAAATTMLVLASAIGLWLGWMVRHDYALMIDQIATHLSAVDAVTAAERLSDTRTDPQGVRDLSDQQSSSSQIS